MVISELDSQKIDNKMGRVSFMKEPGRKLFLYDSLCQDPLNWTKLRKMKRSFLTGAKVNMTCQQAGQQGADTLAPVKDTYITYKTERQPDQLCEDIVACIVPGISADNPRNDMLDAAWRSLKALGNKHIGPKIGTIQMNKAELLQQVYTRGAWNRTPDHHVVFTYQAVPRQSTGRKRMKYLSDGTSLGDTAFNVWPVPVICVANMPKVSAKIHDDIFDQDVAQDSGAEDGSGAAVAEDLGDNLIPFPRELSDKLAREMIHVWEIDVGVIFNPGSGKALLAFILENRRAHPDEQGRAPAASVHPGGVESHTGPSRGVHVPSRAEAVYGSQAHEVLVRWDVPGRHGVQRVAGAGDLRGEHAKGQREDPR